MPYEEEQKDFNLKYEHTYISLQVNGVNCPMWVSSITEDGYIRGRLWNDIEEGWSDIDENDEIEIENPDLNLDFPRLGAINLVHTPIVIRRLAKRQWRKVLCDQVIHLYDPFVDEREKFDLPRILAVENNSILRAIFNPIYPSREEAWELLASGEKLGVAITPEWYLGIKTHAEGVKLFKDDISVGTVIGQSTVILYPEAKLLREQVISLGYKVEAA